MREKKVKIIDTVCVSIYDWEQYILLLLQIELRIRLRDSLVLVAWVPWGPWTTFISAPKAIYAF